MSTLPRPGQVAEIRECLARHRCCAVLAPALAGKTTLARQIQEWCEQRRVRVANVAFSEAETTLEQVASLTAAQIAGTAPDNWRSAPHLLADLLAEAIFAADLPTLVLLDGLDVLPDEVLRQFAAELRRFLNEAKFARIRERFQAVLFGAEKLLYLSDRPNSPLSGIVGVVYLPDLTASQSQELFQAETGASLDADAVATLHCETAGNPYFVGLLATRIRSLAISSPDAECIRAAADAWSSSGEIANDECVYRALRSMRDSWRVWESVVGVVEGAPLSFSPSQDQPLLMNGVLIARDGELHLRGNILSRAVRSLLDDVTRADIYCFHGRWDRAEPYFQRVSAASVWARRNSSRDQGVRRVVDLFSSMLPTVSRLPSLDETARMLAQFCRYFLGAESARIWRAEPNASPLVVAGVGNPAKEQDADRTQLLSAAFRRQTTLMLSSNRGLVHPLGHDPSETRWALELHFPGGMPRENWVEDSLRYLDSMLFTALERATKRQEDARRREAQRKLIHRITLNLQKATQVREVISQIVHGVQAELGYECAQLSLVFLDEGLIRAVEANGVFERIQALTIRQLLGDDILALVVDERQPKVIADCSAPDSHCEPRAVEISGIKSLVVLPLVDGDEAVGVLQVGDTQHTGAFDFADVELLQPLADVAAVAITVARERERLAQLLEATGDAVAFVNRNERIQSCNDEYYNLYQVQAGEPTPVTSSRDPDVSLVRAAFDRGKPIHTVREVGTRSYELTAVGTADAFGAFAGGIEIIGVTNPLHGLTDSLAELLRSTGEQELAERVVKCSCQRLGYTRARFYRLETTRLISVASQGLNAKNAESFRRGNVQLIRSKNDEHGDGFECLRYGSPLVVIRADHLDKLDRHLRSREIGLDSRHRPVFVQDPAEITHLDELEKAGLAEWVDVPLIANGIPLGKLSVDVKGNDQKLNWQIGVEDIELIGLFGRWVADAYSRLEPLERAKREASFLREVSVVAEGHGLETAAWDFLFNITVDGGPGFNRVVLFLKQSQSEEIAGFLCHGAKDRVQWKTDVERLGKSGDRFGFVTDATRRRIQIEQSAEEQERLSALRLWKVDPQSTEDPLSLAVKSQRPIVIGSHQRMPPDFFSLLKWESSERGFVCPLVYEGEAEGVIYVDNAYSGNPIRDEDRRLLQHLCFHLAAIARPIRLAGHLTTQIRNLTHNSISPMTAIRGMAEMLFGQATDEQRDILKDIIAESQRAADTLRRTVRFTSPKAELRLNPQPVQLGALLRERIHPYELILRQDEVDVEVDVPDAGFVVQIDSDLIGDAFAELAANALQVLRDAPEDTRRTLRVRLQSHDTEAEIVFENSGRLIREHLRPRIFDQFVSWSGSTGIGLSLVRQILEKHNGRIEYSVSPDGLSVFRLTLPLLRTS